jgi:predicted flap endonuclease-1-like 5' DNA nuclease/DNA-directed RNA polymerase subunit RPC12/RpoP
LPIEYVCRKCSKTYSNQEYEQSRFCRVCGSFLLRNFRDERYAQRLAQRSFGNQAASSKPDGSFKEKIALTRAAESLRQRIAISKEYEVVSETEKATEKPKESAVESWIWSSEYDEALRLEKKLIKQYEGKALEEAIAGEVVSNQQGECYSISASCGSNFKKATYQESRQLIISDLKVLPGIGPAREQTLKQQGYKTIEELENHPLWKKQAHDFMKIINKKEIPLIQNWLVQT